MHVSYLPSFGYWEGSSPNPKVMEAPETGYPELVLVQILLHLICCFVLFKLAHGNVITKCALLKSCIFVVTTVWFSGSVYGFLSHSA